MAIESRLVSKTIESAQTRVEGFNFDIRKRVVEFDDVINRQRETIYAERDKVLRNEDLGDTVLTFLDAEVDAIVDTFAASESRMEWNLEGLTQALRAMGLEGDETSEEQLDEFPIREALIGHLRDLVAARLEAKTAEVGEADWSLVERLVLLRTIDSLWVEHLTEIDDMRRGIGLRGYAQQDPLNEFKKEAFSLYEELRSLIRHQVATTVFRVTVTRNPPPEAEESRLAADLAAGADAVRRSAPVAAAAVAGGAAKGLPRGPDMRGTVESLGDERVGGSPAGAGGGSGALRPGYAPDGRRMGRNDACFCGSGLKYKKCHGR